MINNKFFLSLAVLAFLSASAGFSFQAGISAGGGFESHEKNSSVSTEISGFCSRLEALGHFKVARRLEFFPGAGIQFSENFQNFFAGTRIAWKIHPHYSPFIGGGLYYRYYPKLGEESGVSLIWAGFSAGFTFLTLDSSHFWFFMDYGFFQSRFDQYISGDFTLNIAWLFDL